MTDSTLLDIIALIGGGRGDPITDLMPHLLAAVTLAALCLFLWRSGEGYRNTGETLLLTAFAALTLNAVLEILSVSGTLAGFHSVSEHGVFWPPAALALSALFHVFLVVTFTMGLDGQRRLMADYLTICTATVFLAGAYVTFLWWNVHINNPGTLFSEQTFVWVVHGTQFILTGCALSHYLRSARPVHWPTLTAVILLLIQCTVQIAIVMAGSDLNEVLQPIAGCLMLGAYLLFSYAALRFHLHHKTRMQNRIESAQRMQAVGLLSSGIAHDFNNHLQIISGYVELGKTSKNCPVVSQQALQRIGEAADRAGTLVNQLLTFSRHQPPKLHQVDLNETIVRLTPILARLAGSDARLIHDLDLGARAIDADESMIEQAIINLVTNARDAVERKGIITLSTHSYINDESDRNKALEPHYRTRLSVRDNGMGMDESTADRMFEPFFTTKIDGGGTGLGLATVQSIVQKHQGCISVDSKPGEYTCVVLDFKASECELAGPSSSVAVELEVPAGKGETILLAEQEQAIRELAQSLLTSSGYRVLIAVNGQHAINIANTYRPGIQLCLFDINMPLLDGCQTYKRIRLEHPEIPALFLTGMAVSQGQSLEDVHYLQKPFTKTHFLHKVREVLDEASDQARLPDAASAVNRKNPRHLSGASG